MVVTLTTTVGVATSGPASAGTITVAQQLVASADPTDLVVVDMNGDGRLDLAVADLKGIRVHLRKLDGTYASPVRTTVPGKIVDLDTADFNGDGAPDLVAIVQEEREGLHLLRHIGNGRLDRTSWDAGTLIEASVDVGDFDGDGRVDVLVGQTASGLSLLRGGGNMSVGAPEPLPAPTGIGGEPFDPIVVDLDGDGKLDIAAALLRSATTIVYRGRGNGTFDAPKTVGAHATAPHTSAAGDFDNDGDLDLLSIGASGGVWITLQGPGFLFTVQPKLAVTGRLNDAAAVDLDGDGNIDAAVTTNRNVVVQLEGNGRGGFTASEVSITGVTLDIDVADVDRDGRPDLAVAAFTRDQVVLIKNRSSFPATTVSVDDVTVTEREPGRRNPFPSAVFTVRRVGDSSRKATVAFHALSSTAVVGQDFRATDDTVTFEANVTNRRVAVVILNDTVAEPTEQFFVLLDTPVGVGLGDPLGVGTILDDDVAPPPAVTMSIADASITEPDTGTVTLKFRVTLSTASAGAVTVKARTFDGTATVADNDYVARNFTLTFAAGQTSRNVVVTVNGDSTTEPNETMRVELSAPSGAAITDGSAVGTIRNND